MHELIILRGNSGSGKTCVSKELQKRFGHNAMLISQDIVRREMLNVKDGENTPALPLLKELLTYGSCNYEIVILEGILKTDWYQPLFELAEDLYQSHVHSYYFDISFEETLRRHQTKPNCNNFGEKELRDWWIEKDYSEILNEKMITEEQYKNSIVEEIYSSVMEGY